MPASEMVSNAVPTAMIDENIENDLGIAPALIRRCIRNAWVAFIGYFQVITEP